MEKELLFLKTILCCSACDGEIAPEEISTLKSIILNMDVFKTIDIENELNKLIESLNEKGVEFLMEYVDSISETTLYNSEVKFKIDKTAPKITSAKIGDVVGQRGKTINEIIDRTGVKIDITDDGFVSVCGVEQDKMNEAVEMIRVITTDFEPKLLSSSTSSLASSNVTDFLSKCLSARKAASVKLGIMISATEQIFLIYITVSSDTPLYNEPLSPIIGSTKILTPLALCS